MSDILREPGQTLAWQSNSATRCPARHALVTGLDNVDGGAEQLDSLSISAEKLKVIAIAKDAAESLSTSLQSLAGDILSHKIRLRISRKS